MTPEQQRFFREKGYLLLKGALGKEQAEPVRRHVLNELKRLKIWSSGKILSGLMKEVPIFQQVTKLGQLIKYPDLQNRIFPQHLNSAMNTLAAARLTSAQDAQLLLSLPNQGDWTLAGLNWHVDISPARNERLPGVQAFILIDDVLPRGGATLALAGSHLLKRSSKHADQNIHELLKKGDGIEEKLAEHGLSVLEMTGRAGDVYLMDMRLLHTPSINATKHVRMMATARYFASY